AAITNHGFGHATRSVAVLADLQRRCPELKLIIVTTAPQWLLDKYLVADYVYRPRVLDVGAVQSDSFTIDRDKTLQALNRLRDSAQSLIEEEVGFIKEEGVSLLYGDIPPMLGYIAEAAGLLCWMSSNFGWDLIYREWGEKFRETVDWVQGGFSKCDRLFRVPFHESMPAFQSIEDVGLTGGRAAFTEAELREKFQIEVERDRVVMLTFGGYGIANLPYENIARFPDWQFITFDREAPDTYKNLLRLDGKAIRPVDVMPVCGRLVGKPGYSTFSEAMLHDVPIVSLPRAGFAEAQYLIEGLVNHSFHQLLEPNEFETSGWEFLHRPLTTPRTDQKLPKNGNGVIADAIAAYF
ncbi:MAG: glycosyl transferase, partial [Cyanobacteria bacterium P01_F01_bin.42]